MPTSTANGDDPSSSSHQSISWMTYTRTFRFSIKQRTIAAHGVAALLFLKTSKVQYMADLDHSSRQQRLRLQVDEQIFFDQD
jgi:hypothetical protein